MSKDTERQGRRKTKKGTENEAGTIIKGQKGREKEVDKETYREIDNE